jgi:hypothetical protein
LFLANAAPSSLERANGFSLWMESEDFASFRGILSPADTALNKQDPSRDFSQHENLSSLRPTKRMHENEAPPDSTWSLKRRLCPHPFPGRPWLRFRLLCTVSHNDRSHWHLTESEPTISRGPVHRLPDYQSSYCPSVIIFLIWSCRHWKRLPTFREKSIFLPSIVRMLHSNLETDGFSFHIDPETNIQELHEGIQINFTMVTFWRGQVASRRISSEWNWEIDSEPANKLIPENSSSRMETASVEWQRTKMQIEWPEICEVQLQSARGRHGMNIHLQPTRPGWFWLAIKILNKFQSWSLQLWCIREGEHFIGCQIFKARISCESCNHGFFSSSRS